MRIRQQICRAGMLLGIIAVFTGCGSTATQESRQTAVTGAATAKEEDTEAADTEDSAVYGVVDLTSYVTLGEYKGVCVKRVKPQQVTASSVKEQIGQQMRSAAGKKKEKTGAIKKGDYVVVSFQGYIGQMQIEQAHSESMTLQVGEYVMLKDFEDALIGKKKDDIFTAKVKMPKDYDPEYAGQTVEYDIKIMDVFQYDVPKITDANVKKYLNADSVKKLKKQIRKSLKKEYQKTAKEEMDKEAMNQVIANARIKEYPEKYVQQFAKQAKKAYEADAAEKGMTWAEYVQEMGLTEDQFEKQIESMAKADLASEMVYQAVIKKENLTVTSKEIAEAAGDYADGTTYASAEEVMEKTDADRLEQRVLYKKAFEWVADHAVIYD